MAPKVAVIGGGCAGMAAAVELAKAGVPLTVFEARDRLGGRVAPTGYGPGESGLGEHLLLGFYTETLALLRFLGVRPSNFHVSPFGLEIPERLSLRVRSLPAPFHFYTALLLTKGLDRSDKIAALKFLQVLRKRHRLLAPDYTLAELLSESQQTARIKELVWEPLCLEWLKTPVERASAQAFGQVVLDMMDAGSSYAEQLVPRQSLADLLAMPAASYLSREGHSVRMAAQIDNIRLEDELFALEGDEDRAARYSHVIVATAPREARSLLGSFDQLTLLCEQMGRLPWTSIATIHLGYGEALRLPSPIVHLTGSIVSRLMDLGQIGREAGNIVAFVPEKPGTPLPSAEELGLAAHQAVEKLIPRLPLPAWSQVQIKAGATLVNLPSLLRPRTITPLRNLFLAGDYVETGCASGLESAVRSGRQAARHVLRSR